jgi:hypothetical protein
LMPRPSFTPVQKYSQNYGFLYFDFSKEPNKVGVSLLFTWRWKQMQFPKWCLPVFRILDDGQSPETWQFRVSYTIHHRTISSIFVSTSYLIACI